MGEFLGFDPTPKKNKTSRVSIVEAKKMVREGQKILRDIEDRLNLINGRDFNTSIQLQEWFQTEIGKMELFAERFADKI